MTTQVHRRLLLIATWCTAGLALVASVTVSCGNVTVKTACAQGCPDMAVLESRLAELEDRAAPLSSGSVGIGTIVAHTTHLAGSTSVDEMRAAGFAVCDGTIPASQGIPDAVLTGPTPDLRGRFLRGTSTSGEFQEDATAVKGLVAVVNQVAHTHAQAAHGHAATGGAHVHGLNNHTHGMNHTHLTRISDFAGFCNPNSVPGSQNAMSNPTDWNRTSGSGCHYTTSTSRNASAPLNSRNATDASTGNTASATPVLVIGATAAVNNPATVDIAVSVASTDRETRPHNMSVVWMMRVR